MIKKCFFKSGVAVLFLCSFAQASIAATVHKPEDAWIVKPISAKKSGEPGYCAMKNEFTSGPTMIIARDTTGANAIALDFHKNKFDTGIRYNMTARAGSVTRDVDGLAASKQVLLMQMGVDTEFFNALAHKHAVSFTAGKNKYSFDLDASAADALVALGHCSASIQIGMTFAPAQFPLGKAHPQSLKELAGAGKEPGVEPAAGNTPAAADIDANIDNQAADSKNNANKTPAEDIDANIDNKVPGSKPVAANVAPAVANTQPVVAGATDVLNKTPANKTADNKTTQKKAVTKAAENKTVASTAAADIPAAGKTADVAADKTANNKTAEDTAADRTASSNPAGDKLADDAENIAAGKTAGADSDERPVHHRKHHRHKQAKKAKTQPLQKEEKPYVEVVEEQPSPRQVDTVRDDIKAEIASEILALTEKEKTAASGTVRPPVAATPVPPLEKSSLPGEQTQNIAPEVQPQYRPESIDMKGLLLSSHVLSDQQIKVSSNGVLHWAADGLFGSAQQSPLISGKSLTDTASDYLRKTASICKGDFAQKVGQVQSTGGLSMLQADITCIDGQNDAAAAVLFIGNRGTFSVITEEGAIDQLHTAMENRDAIIAAAQADTAPNSAPVAPVLKKKDFDSSDTDRPRLLQNNVTTPVPQQSAPVQVASLQAADDHTIAMLASGSRGPPAENLPPLEESHTATTPHLLQNNSATKPTPSQTITSLQTAKTIAALMPAGGGDDPMPAEDASDIPTVIVDPARSQTGMAQAIPAAPAAETTPPAGEAYNAPLQPTPHVTSRQPNLASVESIELGVEVSRYKYREKTATADPFVNNSGWPIGIDATYTAPVTSTWYLRGETRLANGPVNYSSASGTAAHQDNIQFELRGMVGDDFVFNNFSLSPYAGAGYRYLRNDARGLTSLGIPGYRRISQYHYEPVGLTERTMLSDRTMLSTNLEYDFFDRGTQQSFLGDAVPGLGTVVNHQHSGMGLRGDVLFHIDGWSFGPWFNYWHIHDSDFQVVPGSGGALGGLEPNNKTTELGLKLMKQVW